MIKNIHMSKTPIDKLRRKVKQETDPDIKPNGFWYAIENSWIDWVNSEMPNWRGKYLYQVFTDNVNILKLKTEQDINNFEEKYGVIRYNKMFIQWNSVADDYDGIEISEYDYRLRVNHYWYYSWDVASGCVWNLSNMRLKVLK